VKDLLASAFCCVLFLWFALSVVQFQLWWEGATRDRLEADFSERVGELYNHHPETFPQLCDRLGASAAIWGDGGQLWRHGVLERCSVRLPVCFENRLAEVRVWTG